MNNLDFFLISVTSLGLALAEEVHLRDVILFFSLMLAGWRLLAVSLRLCGDY